MLRWIAVLLVFPFLSSAPSGADDTRSPTAPWPSIEAERRTVEYEVRADSFDEALDACRRLGPNGWPGFTEWDLVWRYDFSEYAFETRPHGDRQRLTVRDLAVTVTSVKVVQTTHLPKLVPGEAFGDEDRRAWGRWYADLRAHESAHQRISSVAAIGDWLKRRVAGIRYLEQAFPAERELGPREAEQVIRSELTAVYDHARARIQDKNKELDQRTGHGGVELDWDAFLEGYF